MEVYKNKKGVVSSGHSLTTDAAVEILEDGGNAYDAVLAAYLAATVVEPVLTSLGGGGYLLAHTALGDDVLYDFFVHTPSSKNSNDKPDFYPVTVDFGTTTQDFHIGKASVAVPGGVMGVLKIHEELGSLPLERIIQPAKRYATEGVLVNSFQEHLFDILKPIFISSEKIKSLYMSKSKTSNKSDGRYIKNLEYAKFLDTLVKEGSACFYEGGVAKRIVSDMNTMGGYITEADLKKYKVIKRVPIKTMYRGAKLITNPPPSAGGVLIAFALSLCDKLHIDTLDFGSVKYIALLTDIMKMTNTARVHGLDGKLFEDNIVEKFLDSEFVDMYKKEVEGVTNHMGSTTQISVIDSFGNCASMTTSNGEGSGYIVPGTGIHLNNMLGEEDLHPHGFHNWNKDERISSMMSPSVLIEADGRKIAFGSGGSNRIRTALLQVILNVINHGMDVEQAVESTRIHFEKGTLDIEPGFTEEVLDDIKKNFDEVNIHKHKGVFFGGVHCAVWDTKENIFSGVGDLRRSGVYKLAGNGEID